MKDIKYYYCVDRNEEIEIPNVSYPQSFTDVMDGTWDTGSFEFFIDINIYKRDFNIRETDVVSRKIIENGNIIDDTRFLVDEINIEKDSYYENNILKVTIKYVEATKILTKYLMPNHTYSIKPIFDNVLNNDYQNNLYKQYIYKYFYGSKASATGPSQADMIYERNYQNFIYKDGLYAFEPSEELIEISKQYPDKTTTYVDSNFYDITRDCFSIFNAVPYLNMKDRKLNYISGLGKETDKKIEYGKNKFVISDSWNRSIENNTDVIENKIENTICDFEELVYPSDLNEKTLFDELNQSYKFTAMVVKPRGLNEGLENYQNWYNWYLELPQKIDNILAAVALRIEGNENNTQTKKIITRYIIEKSSWDQLTETDKKYYAYFKRGDNKIYNIMQTVVDRENDVWPWDRANDNEKAFQTSFWVKYKPIISTDVLIVKNKNNLINKKNFVVSDKNSSDIYTMAKTNYELEKGFYSQYMLEIAGEYQNIYAGEIVEIVGFENYGIDSKKYLIYKVNTTWEKEGCHQIIYFNEMVAKNNVLLNENNIIRITEQPSDETLIERIYKNTDLIELNAEVVDSTTYEPYTLNGYGDTDFILSSLRMLFGKETANKPNSDGTQDVDRHKLRSAKCKFYYRDLNLEDLQLSSTQSITILEKKLDYFNSGTVSQAIMSTIDNIIFDYKGELKSLNHSSETKLKASVPVKYSNQLGMLDGFIIKLTSANVGGEQSKIYDEDGNLVGYNYPYYNKTSYEFDVNVKGHITLNNTYTGSIKDTRDILKIVYEQTYCSGNENLQLSNYFTSTSSSFSIDERFASDYLYKDILFFEGKVYNINDIDENKAIGTEKIEDATSKMLFTDDYNIFFKIPDNLIVGQDYTMVLRGVINRYKISGNTYGKRMVPQLSFHFKKEQGTKYIRFSIDVLKL
jgi:hypothetical protein